VLFLTDWLSKKPGKLSRYVIALTIATDRYKSVPGRYGARASDDHIGVITQTNEVLS